MNEEILKLYKSIVQSNQEETSQDVTQEQQKNDTKLISLKENYNQQQQQQTSIKREVSLTTRTQQQTTHNTLKRQNNDQLTAAEILAKKKREKCSKGLRHFSMKVCEKVKAKGTTTYNEVADELVNEYCDRVSGIEQINDYWSYDQKNVRRRVYDALNVLMAMNIISKEKKEIKWIGLPCNKKQELKELENEKIKRLENIKNKSEQLKDLLLEQIATKNLINRNKSHSIESNTIDLPFVLVNTDKKTVIDCNISTDKKEYSLNFDNTFEIQTHLDVLKKIGLTKGLENGNCSNLDDVNEACSIVPRVFEPYVKQMAKSNEIKPILTSASLPNYKSSSAKYENSETHASNLNNKNLLDLSGDDFSGGETEPSESENESLDDSSS